MSKRHRQQTGVNLHYPKGTSFAGVDLDLEDDAARAVAWTNQAGTADVLVVSGSGRSVTCGSSARGLTYAWKATKNETAAYAVVDTDGNAYLTVSTSTSAPAITLGGATNPSLVWSGSGAWSVGGGVGTAGQVLTSGGAGAAPTWTTIASGASSTGTTSATYEINNAAAITLTNTTGILYVSSNTGGAALRTAALTQARTSASLVFSETLNGVNEAPTFIVGLDSTSAAATATFALSAASGGTQRTATMVMTGSTNTVLLGGSAYWEFDYAPSCTRGGTGTALYGYNATGGGHDTAIGHSAVASGTGYATALGFAARADDGGMALGANAQTTFASIALTATATAAGQFIAGNTSVPITAVIIGRGDTSATPGAVTHRITNASGSNVAGANTTHQAGLGTGSASSGYWRVLAGVAGASGTTLNSTAEVLRIDGGAAGGRVGFFGVTPAARQATPSTLADVIALLQAYGLAV